MSVASIKGYYTTAEAAEELEVSPGRVRQFEVEGRLKSHKIGNALLFDIKEVKEFKRLDRPSGRPKNSQK